MSLLKLAYGLNGKRAACFRSLTGEHERIAAGRSHELLKCLSISGDEFVSGDEFDQVPICDRDRALAFLYCALYDDTIVSHASCSECDYRFEIKFSLADLAKQALAVDPVSPPHIKVCKQQLRLPTIADLSKTTGKEADDLLVVLSGEESPLTLSSKHRQEILNRLELANPILELDLVGHCPECKTENKARFSISAFFDRTLTNELGFLFREVHLLAQAYQWSLQSILSLTRHERHSLIKLIVGDSDGSRHLRRAV